MENTPKILEIDPPNIEEIRKVLPDSELPTCYAYGDTIYNPKKVKVGPDLLIHELKHLEAQGYTVEGAKEWWKFYLEDKKFRLDEELKGYGAQLKYIKHNYNNKIYKTILFKIADALSSSMYGKLVTFQQAETLARRASQ